MQHSSPFEALIPIIMQKQLSHQTERDWCLSAVRNHTQNVHHTLRLSGKGEICDELFAEGEMERTGFYDGEDGGKNISCGGLDKEIELVV